MQIYLDKLIIFISVNDVSELTMESNATTSQR